MNHEHCAHDLPTMITNIRREICCHCGQTRLVKLIYGGQFEGHGPHHPQKPLIESRAQEWGNRT